MTYQEEAQSLADQTAQQVLAVLAAYAAGTITLQAATGIIAAYIAAGTTGAAALADLSVAAAVTLQTGQPAPPLGIIRDADVTRLENAAKTVLDDLDADTLAEMDNAREKAEMRIRRLAEAEIRKAVAETYSEAVAASPTVTGWTRGLEPDACELCTWWWREGRIWPADHPFQHHTGCDCSQIVVTTTEPIKPISTRNRRSA